MAGEKDRRVASNRAQAIDYLGTRNKLPKITRFENCTMEIDSARGVITVAHDGRIKVLVTRIPTRKLELPTVRIIAAAEK